MAEHIALSVFIKRGVPRDVVHLKPVGDSGHSLLRLL